MVIHLIRHAQFDSNDRGKHPEYYDPALNGIGRQQAEALGRRLREHCFVDALYTSDLARAFQMAEVVAETLDMKPQADVRFRFAKVIKPITFVIELY